MRGLFKILFILVILEFLILTGIYTYAKEDSGVLVSSPSQKTEEQALKEQGLEGEILEAPGSARTAFFIEGKRIADVAISEVVTIDKDWVISYVEPPTGVGFTLVRVGRDGVERQVLEVDSPMMVAGKGFPAGKYKVYPCKVTGIEMSEISIRLYFEPKEQEGRAR